MSVSSPKTVSASIKSRSWLIQLTILSFILGILLALSLQTQHRFTSQGLPPRYSALATRYFELESVNRDTEQEIKNLRGTVAELEDALKQSAKNSTGKDEVLALSTQLEKAQRFAGLTAMKGPGIEIVLSDAPNAKELAEQLAAEQGTDVQSQLANFMVHDQDIVGVVNELKQAGAEAIAVNGQRIVATSSIRCVGPILHINHKSLGGGAPFTITAIGSSRDLEAGMKLPGGYLDQQQLFQYNMVTIKQKDEIIVPEFTGLTEFDFAKAVPQTNGQPVPAVNETPRPMNRPAAEASSSSPR